MAGFFSGLGAALGGAGQAAVPYGQQVRGILEARKHDLADNITRIIPAITDPDLKANLSGLMGDVYGNKPIGPLIQKFQMLVQKHQQNEQAFHQAIGPGPQPAPPVAGSAAGITPGNPVPAKPDFVLPGLGIPEINGLKPTNNDFTGLLTASAKPATVPPPPPAAQPSTNPIAGHQPGGIEASPEIPLTTTGLRGGGTAQNPLLALPQPAAPMQALSTLPAPTTGLEQFESDPYYQNLKNTANNLMQHGWAVPESITSALAPYQQHGMALRQEEALRQMDLNERQTALKQMDLPSLPPQLRAQWTAWAHSRSAPLPNVSALQRPVNFGGVIPSSNINEEELLDMNGNPIDAKTTPFVRQHLDLLGGKSYYTPAVGPTITIAGQNGLEVAPRLPGAIQASGGGAALPPSTLTRVVNGGVDATGHTIFFNPLNPLGTHVTAPGVNASVLPTVTGHTSITNPDGSVVSSTQRSKVLTPLVKPAVSAPGVKAAPSETPVPTGPGAPAVPTTTPLPPRASVAPFNPTNRLDSLVQQIANGDTTLEKAKTNARDKFQIEDRMAQLGLTPANITTSMRERATNARNILKEMDRIDGIITQADKDGDLGVVATRWNDFLTNKLGADPTKTQVFSKLSSDLGFLSTAVSMAHGGLRGGSSPTMVEHWEKALDAKDPATLKSKLGEARQWMEQYAQMDKGLKGQPITPIQQGGSVVNDLINKYK